MPNRNPASARASDDAPQLPPLDRAQRHADALVRAAVECCRQHDRLQRVLEKAATDSEEQAVTSLCRACDTTLDSMVTEFETSASAVSPRPTDPWWAKATAMWIAARDYTRHHVGCDELARRMRKHSSDQLGSMHVEWELEASALLALKQACDEYIKARPDAA